MSFPSIGLCFLEHLAVYLLTLFLPHSHPPTLPPSLQCGVPSETQGHTEEVCHEEDQQTSHGHEETGGAGVLREGHPHVCRESICCGTLVYIPDKGTYVLCVSRKVIIMAGTVHDGLEDCCAGCIRGYYTYKSGF